MGGSLYRECIIQRHGGVIALVQIDTLTGIDILYTVPILISTTGVMLNSHDYQIRP